MPKWCRTKQHEFYAFFMSIRQQYSMLMVCFIVDMIVSMIYKSQKHSSLIGLTKKYVDYY